MNNGYTTLEIEGQQVGIKFGLPAVTEMFEKKTPETDIESMVYTAELIYAGYKNNCLVKREPYTLPFELFYDFVEDSFLQTEKLEQLNKIVAVFNESKFVAAGKKIVAEQEQASKKKSGQPTKLKSSATVS